MKSMEWRSESAPDWFRNAVAQPTETHFAFAGDTRIHYLSWNAHERAKPGLLLMHGFRAHARWWSWIAPFLTERFRVYALDFSGMGDSGWRHSYDPLVFTHDIAAVVRDAEIGPATLVAHSFGGSRLLRLCAEQPELIEHAVIIDSYVHFEDADMRRPVVRSGPHKIHPTYEAAKARYRLTPPESSAADYVIDYIAHHSLTEVDGGFRWKFAANVGSTDLMERDGAAVLRRIRVPLTYMFGELSRLGGSLPRRIMSHIPHARGPIAIPQAHHHVMLDQPLSLVAALRSALY